MNSSDGHVCGVGKRRCRPICLRPALRWRFLFNSRQLSGYGGSGLSGRRKSRGRQYIFHKISYSFRACISKKYSVAMLSAQFNPFIVWMQLLVEAAVASAASSILEKGAGPRRRLDTSCVT